MVRPRLGTFVRPLTVEEFDQLYDIRLASACFRSRATAVADKDAVPSIVNRLGAEGWELVSMVWTGWREEVTLCTKRALP